MSLIPDPDTDPWRFIAAAVVVSIFGFLAAYGTTKYFYPAGSDAAAPNTPIFSPDPRYTTPPPTHYPPPLRASTIPPSWTQQGQDQPQPVQHPVVRAHHHHHHHKPKVQPPPPKPKPSHTPKPTPTPTTSHSQSVSPDPSAAMERLIALVPLPKLLG